MLRLTLEEVRARNDKLERSHSHLKKQKTQLLADLQVSCSVHLLHWQRCELLCITSVSVVHLYTCLHACLLQWLEDTQVSAENTMADVLPCSASISVCI